MSSFTDNPAGDAADHFNKQADTVWQVVELFGINLTVEANIHSRGACAVFDDDGNDWYDKINAKTLRELAAQALEKYGTV